MTAIYLAQMVNHAAGGAVIAPWEIGAMSDDWIDACRAMSSELPDIQEAHNIASGHLAKFRAAHPTYRKI